MLFRSWKTTAPGGDSQEALAPLLGPFSLLAAWHLCLKCSRTFCQAAYVAVNCPAQFCDIIEWSTEKGPAMTQTVMKGLCDAFVAYTQLHDLPDGDAMELVMFAPPPRNSRNGLPRSSPCGMPRKKIRASTKPRTPQHDPRTSPGILPDAQAPLPEARLSLGNQVQR